MTFKAGQSGNPNGRPKKPEVEELRKALKATAKEKGEDFLTNYTARAYKSDPMAIALLKKLVPDLTEADLKTDGQSLVDILALMRSRAGRGDKDV